MWDLADSPSFVAWLVARTGCSSSEGGETAPGNLALLCSRHHHKVHVPDWAMKLLPDGEVHITKPDGTELVSYPRSE